MYQGSDGENFFRRRASGAREPDFVVRVRVIVHVRYLGDEFGQALSNNLKNLLQ
jgi:hypothetical protein